MRKDQKNRSTSVRTDAARPCVESEIANSPCTYLIRHLMIGALNRRPTNTLTISREAERKFE